jgi:hypothetical protein
VIKNTDPKEGDLEVWWVPQVPMASFRVPVKTIREARLLLETLANYDLFQFENNVKPDYSNAGGLEIFENGEWTDWYDEESGDDIDNMDKETKIRLGVD